MSIQLESAKARIATLEEQKRIYCEKRSMRFEELKALVRHEDIPTSYYSWPFQNPTVEQLEQWGADAVAAAYSKHVVELVKMIEEDKQNEAYQEKIIVETGRGINYIQELDHDMLRIIMCEEIWRAAEYKHRMAPIGEFVRVLETTFRGHPNHGAIYWMQREDTATRWRRVKYMY